MLFSCCSSSVSASKLNERTTSIRSVAVVGFFPSIHPSTSSLWWWCSSFSLSPYFQRRNFSLLTYLPCLLWRRCYHPHPMYCSRCMYTEAKQSKAGKLSLSLPPLLLVTSSTRFFLSFSLSFFYLLCLARPKNGWLLKYRLKHDLLSVRFQRRILKVRELPSNSAEEREKNI